MTVDRKEEIRIMSLPKMQKLFREKMGPLQHGDPVLLKNDPLADFYCIDCLEHHVFSPKLYDGAIRLPLGIDRDNPERGLAGMLDGRVELRQRIDETWIVVLHKQGEYSPSFVAGTPTIALLRALCKKIGEEVE